MSLYPRDVAPARDNEDTVRLRPIRPQQLLAAAAALAVRTRTPTTGTSFEHTDCSCCGAPARD